MNNDKLERAGDGVEGGQAVTKDTDLITVSWCRERGAHLEDAELHDLLGAGKTAAEVLDLDIPAGDRVWMVSQWLPDRGRRAFLADLLVRLFKRERGFNREPDARSVAVLDALREDRWPSENERRVVLIRVEKAARKAAQKTTRATAAAAEAETAMLVLERATGKAKIARRAMKAAKARARAAARAWAAVLAARAALLAARAARAAATEYEDRAEMAVLAARAALLAARAARAAPGAGPGAVARATAMKAAATAERDAQLACLRRLAAGVGDGCDVCYGDPSDDSFPVDWKIRPAPSWGGPATATNRGAAT